jgi:hypothetical protein
VQPENPNAEKGIDDSAKPPRVRIPRLTSIAAVRRELGRQYACHLRKEIGNKCLDTRVRALRAITESFVAYDQEQRLRALEERVPRA